MSMSPQAKARLCPVSSAASGVTIALTIAISSDTPDLFTYKLPVAQLAVITIAAALAGIVAAWLPARRAAKLDVLDAISSV